MKIGVNLTHLTNDESGAKSYFISLFTQLLKIDNKNKYVFFLSKSLNLDQLRFIKKINTKLVYLNINQKNISGRITLFRYLSTFFFFKKYFSKNEIDIFIHTSLPIIRNPKFKTIVNLFDIRASNSLIENNIFKRFLFFLLLKYCFYFSDYVVTISKSMKNEISRLNNNFNKKLKFFYCSIDANKNNKLYYKKKIIFWQ